MNWQNVLLDAVVYSLHSDAVQSSQWNGQATLDSRSVIPGQMFVAMQGEKTDGRNYIYQAVHAGAALVLCATGTVKQFADSWSGLSILPSSSSNAAPLSAHLIEVPDVESALIALATDRRCQFSGHVVGITGSYGKTTTKEVLLQMLDATGTCGNYNNHLGVPLTVLNANFNAPIWVIEMGMSAPGEIARLAAIARPNTVVFTPLGSAHAGGSTGGSAWIAREKTSIITTGDTQLAYVPVASDAYCDALSQHGYEGAIVRYGNQGDASFHSTVGSSTRVDISTQNHTAQVEWDLATLMPADAVEVGLRILQQLKMPISDKYQLQLAAVLPGRMQTIKLSNRRYVINDAYNASPETFESFIDWCHSQHVAGVRTKIVLGDMRELGPDLEDDAHSTVIKQIEKLELDYCLFLRGSTIFSSVTNTSVLAFDDCIEWLYATDEPAMLACKASHGAGLYDAIQEWEQAR